MKLYFRSLAPVKKDAAQLRKLIKKNTSKNLKIQVVQDIIATMYGWQHYNEMSYIHLNPGKAYPVKKTADIFTEQAGSMTLPNDNEKIRLIDQLDKFERQSLEFKKRSLLERSLSEHKLSDEDKQAVIFAYFDKRSLFTRLTESMSGDTIHSLMQIPESMWRAHSLCLGTDKRGLAQFYADVPVSHAVERGGLFILRESMVPVVWDRLRSLVPATEHDRLHLLNADTGPEAESKSRLDILATEDIAMVFAYVRGCIEDSGNGSEMYVGRSAQLLSSVERILVARYGNERGVLANKKVSFSLDALMELAYVDDLPVKSIAGLRKFIAELPGFSFESLEAGKPQDMKVSENLAWVTMHFSEVFARLFEMNESDSRAEVISITEALAGKEGELEGNDIVIVMIPDKFDCYHDKFAKGIITLYRQSISLMLNHMNANKQDEMQLKSKASFKPMVLDDYYRYSKRGMAIVSAQAKCYGFAMFFGLGDVGQMRRDEIEWCSMIANSINRFVFKGFDDLNKIRGHEQYDEVDYPALTDNMITKGRCLYTASWMKEEPLLHLIKQ